MVDTGDLKSLASNGVRVQVPPWVFCLQSMACASDVGALLCVSILLCSDFYFRVTQKTRHPRKNDAIAH